MQHGRKPRTEKQNSKTLCKWVSSRISSTLFVAFISLTVMAGMSRLVQAQQYSQAARIDALNPRQINHKHPGMSLTEYGVTQYRTGVASHNSALAPENAGVSQFLNGYLQHHHLLPTFPEIFPPERHPASTS